MAKTKIYWTETEWRQITTQFQASKLAAPGLSRKELVSAAQQVLPAARQKLMTGTMPWDVYNVLIDRVGAQEAAAIVASQPAKAARIVQAPVQASPSAPAKIDLSSKSNLNDLLAQVKKVEQAIQEKVAEDNAEVGELRAANAKLTHENLHGTRLLDAALIENGQLKTKIAELQGPGSLTALVEAMKVELLASQAAQTAVLIQYFETGKRPEGLQATQVAPVSSEPAKSQEAALLEALKGPAPPHKHDPSPIQTEKVRRRVLICGVPEGQLQYFRTNLPEINFQAFDPNKPHFKDGPADADLCILVRNGVVSHSASNAFLTKYGKGKVIQVRKGQGRIMEAIKNHMGLA